MLIAALAVALAADHAEAPGTSPDPVADIGDVFAWHHDGALSVVLTFGGYTSVGQYDADVLYSVHIDTDGDFISDHDVSVRYGAKGDDWAIRVTGLPGQSEALEGPVGDTLKMGSTQVWAGISDDPFFFDLTGFEETLATGTVAFDSTRDFVAGGNCNSIVMDLDLGAFVGADKLNIWATTGRTGGAQ